MGYLFLSLALIFGLIKVYCGKKTSYVANCSLNAIIINTVRMLICFLIGIVIVLSTGVKSFCFEEQGAMLTSFMSGVFIACFTVSWLMSVNNSAYMMVEVFVMGGVFVPLILCWIFNGEPISVPQAIAGLMLVFAVYCMCSDGKKTKGKMTSRNLILLIICAISSGLSDFSQKVYVNSFASSSIALFNMYTYLFAAIILAVCYFVFKSKEKDEDKQKTLSTVVRPIFPHILIMAFCLFLNAYFKTLSSKYLDAILLYPVSQGLAVVFSLIMSVTLFNEKINFKGILGIIIALVSVILINIC